MAKQKTHTFSTGRYRIVTDEVLDGFCFNELPPKSSPFILISAELGGLKRLETVIHEAIHAEFPLLSETKVRVGARRIARLVWAEDYRREESK